MATFVLWLQSLPPAGKAALTDNHFNEEYIERALA